MNDQGMVKLIFSSSFDSSVDAGMRIVEDPWQMKKSASTIFGCNYDDVKPDNDHVGIHVVALGDYEHFGLNRNADGFPKQACINYHETFVKNGHVYRHHRNKNPEKCLGQIVKSAYNTPMGRIELFIHAHKEKAADELQKLDKDGEIPLSMACVLAGTLVMTADGFKAIETLTPGTAVLTHTGAWGLVGNRSERNVESYLEVSLTSWGRTILGITPNHEVYAASYNDIPKKSHQHAITPVSKTFKAAHQHELYKYAHWIPAGQLTDQHYMLMPIDRTVNTDTSVSWSRVLGYYIAEGSMSQGATLFTCNIDDAAVKELTALAPWTSVTVRPKAESESAVTLACYGTELANLIEFQCGRRGENKHIPEVIRHADADAKFNFMATWFNGDGWQDMNGLHWSTHYQALALELQQLLASVNIPSSCCRIDHAYDRGIVKSEDAVEYVVNVTNRYSGLFSDISKAGTIDMCVNTACRPFISGDYLCVPVKSVIRQDTPVTVYNFSVNGDESYTVFGLAVHNCKVAFDRCTVCNTKRKSSLDPEQCEHVRDGLGKMSEDGKIIGTQNDEPHFFDISFVSRPADRIAWNLKSASGAVLDSIKLAEYEGVWIPDRLAITSEGSMKKFEIMKKLAAYESVYGNLPFKATLTASERYIAELRKAASCKLDDATIESLRCFEPKDVFFKLAKAGIIMDVESFYKYALGPQYEVAEMHMDEVKSMLPLAYSRITKEGACQGICNMELFDVEADRYTTLIGTPDDVKLAKVIQKVAHDATFVGPEVDRRIIEATLHQRNIAKPLDKKAGIESNSNVIVNTLVEKYAAYKLSAVKDVAILNRAIDTEALFAVAVAQDLN